MKKDVLVLGFLSRWCAGIAAETAGVNRIKYTPNIVFINVPCVSRIRPEHVVEAFLSGIDGVLIGGCLPPANCHYKTGNFKAFKRMYLLRKLMEQFGVEPERLKMDWFVTPQYEKIARVADSFVEDIRRLGPVIPREA